MSDEESGVTRVTALGVGVALVLLVIQPDFPPLALGAGLVTIGTGLLASQRGRKRYALSGTLYVLSLGIATIALDTVVPIDSAGTIALATLVFGVGSLILATINAAIDAAIDRVLARFEDDKADTDSGGVDLAVSAVELFFVISDLTRRALLFGGAVIGGPATVVLLALGKELTVSLPIVGTEISIAMVGFVGCLLAGFYVLDWLNETWLASKDAVTTGAKAGKKLHSEVSAAVDERADGQTSEQNESGRGQ